jgi:hypothetical protein
MEKAICHVVQTLQLAGFDDPCHTYGAKDLDHPFWHFFKSLEDKDPAPKPQLFLPMHTLEMVGSQTGPNHSANTRPHINKLFQNLVCGNESFKTFRLLFRLFI